MIYKLKSSKRPFKVLEEESKDHNIKVRFLDRASQDDEAIFNDEDLAKASDWPLPAREPIAKDVPKQEDNITDWDIYGGITFLDSNLVDWDVLSFLMRKEN